MKTFKVPSPDEVSPESKVIFDQIRKHLGKLPNLYATIGYSPRTLKGYLEFDAAIDAGVFSSIEKEAIKLVVSEVHKCDYCLAAHTLIAKSKGISRDDTVAFRKGYAANVKLDTLVKLAREITLERGNVDEQLFDQFFELGYDEAALIDLVGLVTTMTFTNYIYALTKVPLDFPEAEPLSF